MFLIFRLKNESFIIILDTQSQHDNEARKTKNHTLKFSITGVRCNCCARAIRLKWQELKQPAIE